MFNFTSFFFLNFVLQNTFKTPSGGDFKNAIIEPKVDFSL